MFRKPWFWAVFILVSVLCTAWAVTNFARAFPLVTLDVTMDRSAAMEAADGLAAAHRVAERIGDRADLARACVANLDLLPIVKGYDRVVVIDAYLSESDPAGTRVRATPDDLPRGFGYRSFHTLPFRELLDLGRAVGWPMPREIMYMICLPSRCIVLIQSDSRLWAEPKVSGDFEEQPFWNI